jgi:hypothetical protein
VERALVAEDASAEKIERLLSAGLGFPREAAASISETLYASRSFAPPGFFARKLLSSPV